MVKGKNGSILFMGTFPPRECGIATFTKDLSSAVQKRFGPKIKASILAMNKSTSNMYNYPQEVSYQVDDSDLENYIWVAKRINSNDSIKLVNVQHEFGIFGGENGKNIIPFLEIVNKPVITTFHSIVPGPDKKKKKIVRFIGKKSVCVIVMNNTAVKILRNDYGLKGDIAVIPHGIPSVKFESNHRYKAALGFGDKTVISSFGLMNPGKGYEHVIDALPGLIKKFPDLLYIIIGETHPVVRMQEGEKYRNFLHEKVRDMGLGSHVKFYNKYVTLAEIIKYLKASDIYVCSAIDRNQITSGTLVYAMGCGRAVVSTPFLHAAEYVTPDKGLLADFGDSQSFEDAISRILTNPELKSNMEKNAYAFTRSMTWPNVAISHMKLFDAYADISGMHEKALPKINFSHVMRMTDDFGLIQFANYLKPDLHSGYCLDDNARAMMAACMDYEVSKSKSKLNLVKKYISFAKNVLRDDGRFCNLVNRERKVNTEDLSEDAHGRALQALGYLISTDGVPEEIRKEADTLFCKAVKAVQGMGSPRAIAFSIMGLYNYNKANPSEDNLQTIRKLSDFLVSLFNNVTSDDWHWFEEYMTYANARIPESLFYSYIATRDKKYLDTARKSLDFLISVTFEDGIFMPIGQRGWYMKNNMKSYFDQQPIDTCAMVQALIAANKVTGEKKYAKRAIDAFHWFLGKNFLDQMVYDENSGGCHDGIGKLSINLNQGAESTVSYLLARLSLAQNGFK